MGYEDYVHSVVTKHNWKQFCTQPANAEVPVVREFYAHHAGEGQRSVYVRGVQVPIVDYAINRIYGLDDVEDLHQEYAAKASGDWLDCALENVCVPGTTWTVSAKGKLTVPRASLTPQCKVWYHFLKTCLMPSTHVQTVSKGCIILLDSIISGWPIDVGAIIFQSLRTCATKKCGSLQFPSLITSLYANSDVPMFDTEERCTKNGVFSALLYFLSPTALLPLIH
ncbi:hypothetical protein TIFTF001_050488 [Ficus carica]|uniref:Putative plant transposon protein domain-containing protein n=1 Tax=Ficus carica TaxID=3494 RepID=A0AA87Z359_FICCA|nr:hypothetical protein TIFTF001_050488 [Ficus carica]